MKIRYKFVNGDVSEIEVNTEWGDRLFAMEDNDAKNDRKNSRSDRHTLLSAFDYEGEVFASDMDVEREVLQRINAAELRQAMTQLSQVQRELLFKVYFEGHSLTSIAAEEGVSHVAIVRRLARIHKKLKKILE